MTQYPNPPAFPEAGTRSKNLALGIVVALVAILVAGAVLAAKVRAPRKAELATAPPSYEEALRKAEAEDMAKGVTPEMAATLRARGTVDAQEGSKLRGQL